MSGYKRYPAYKESGVEWIGEIPAGWSHKMLKFVGNAVLGKMLANDDKGAYSLKPYLRAKNILWERVDADDINEMWFSVREMEQFRVRTNDLLISEGGEVGRTAIWNDELEECYLQNSVHKFTVGKGEEPRFHLYQLVVLGKLGYFDSVVNKVSIGHLTGEKLGPIPLVTPPPSEQTKIAAFLDRKTVQIDRLIEIKRRQIEVLKEERTAVINQAVTKGLNPGVKMKESGIEWIGEIPEGWQVKKIKFVSDLISKGTTPSTIGEDVLGAGEIRFIKAENIANGQVADSPAFFIDEKTHEMLKRSQLAPRDILFVIAGATIGKSAIVDENHVPANTNQAVAFIRPCEDVNEAFVYRWLQSQKIMDLIWLDAVQSAQPNLSMGNLGNFSIPWPPKKEQANIVNYVEENERRIADAIQLNISQIQLLQEYRTTLISDAVTGKIDVREEAA